MMSDNQEFKKVIWAVDAFPPDKGVQFRTAEMLAILTKGTNARIEPVCVLSPDQVRVPANAFGGKSKEYRLEAEVILKGWLKHLRIPNMDEPALLLHDYHSKTNSVNTLLKYARETKTDLIGLSTHTKNKLERFLVGSFAESVLFGSDIPLLVVNPTSSNVSSIDKILFPTDFSDASFAAFKLLLPVARQKKAKVTLFYKFEYLTGDTYPNIHSQGVFAEYLKTDLEEQSKIAEQWKVYAANLDMNVDVILSDKPGFITESIFAVAEQLGVQMIAMASRTGQMASLIIGSVAREVVRQAHVPVWIIHPKEEASKYRKGIRDETQRHG